MASDDSEHFPRKAAPAHGRPAGPAVELAYIGGAGRSGSTLLALLLGRLPGLFPVGGLNNLWERGVRDNYLCGCGEPFRECAFWGEVGREAFGSWSALDIDEVQRLKLSVMRYRQLPWHAKPTLRPAFHQSLLAYGEYLARVCSAVQRVSGCRVIVDNSHDLPPVLMMRHVPTIQPRLLHLVRDSRGVAYSLSKLVLRAESAQKPAYMERYAPVQASIEWVMANLSFHIARARGLPRLKVHYESLVASPSAEVARIAAFLGAEVSAAERSKLDGGTLPVGENHMISGNPHRLGRKTIDIQLDDEWRRGMKPRDRRVVTLLTSPLCLAYGYVGPRRARVRPSASQPGR